MSRKQTFAAAAAVLAVGAGVYQYTRPADPVVYRMHNQAVCADRNDQGRTVVAVIPIAPTDSPKKACKLLPQEFSALR
jgi:hypothetical protein